MLFRRKVHIIIGGVSERQGMKGHLKLITGAIIGISVLIGIIIAPMPPKPVESLKTAQTSSAYPAATPATPVTTPQPQPSVMPIVTNQPAPSVPTATVAPAAQNTVLAPATTQDTATQPTSTQQTTSQPAQNTPDPPGGPAAKPPCPSCYSN